MSTYDFFPVAPKNSHSHIRLIEAAEASGLNTELLRDLLWLIAAHDYLIALPVAAATLLKILDLAPPSWDSSLAESELPSYRAILEWVVKNDDVLAHDIGDHFNRKLNSTGKNPISGSGRGYLYPLYAPLCEIRDQVLDENTYILLIGQLLLANMIALREFSTREEYESSENKPWNPLPNGIEAAALAVRRLAKKKYRKYLMDFEVDLSPEDFAESLEVTNESWDELIQKDRQHLCRLLKKVWGINDWGEGSSGGGGGGGGGKWVGGRFEVNSRIIVETISIGDPDDACANWGNIDVATGKSALKRTQNARLKSDLSPDEDEDDVLIILSSYECGETKQDLGALTRAAKAQSRHMEKANQLVPWEYGGLAIEEFALLRKGILDRWEVLQKLKVWTKAQHNEAETLLLIHVMLWTGSDVKRAAKIIKFSENRDRFDKDVGLVISSIHSDKICWRIKALEPAYKTDLEGTPDQIRKIEKCIDLPDLTGIGPMVKRIKGESVKDGSLLFTLPPDELEKSLKLWLKRYSLDGRITVTKLGNTLWNHIWAKCGDVVIASVLTGTAHPLAKVRMFYTSHSINLLQQIYERTVNDNSQLCRQAIGRDQPTIANWLPYNDVEGAIGARLCPTMDAVESLFAKLVSDIEAAMKYTDRSGFIKFHNLYTLYTIQYFAYATSCRAIVTPYLPPDAIHPTRGIASLSDKDDKYFHKTRLIWIPETLREQMKYYGEHIDVLRVQLFKTSTSMMKEPCIFLTEEFKPVLVRPKTIEPLLIPYMNVRANTHRRFLRTELIERNCPPETVDALLGHWQQGEEPFGKYSSFSFDSYVTTLKEHLQPLLAEIGLKRSIQSRLAR